MNAGVPRDDHLPGLRAVLDTDTVRLLLEAQLDGSTLEITDCRVQHVRYRRGRSCTAFYLVRARDQSSGRQEELFWYSRCTTKKEFALAHRRVSAGTWTKPRVGSPVTSLPRYQAILFAYPNDFALGGLRIAADHDALRQVFSQHLSDDSTLFGRRLRTTLVRYKPEHIAVLEGQLGDAHPRKKPFETRVYLKVYSNDDGRRAHGAMLRLLRFLGPDSRLVIPGVLGFLARHRLLILGAVPGVQLRSLAGTPEERDSYARVGEALARLHAYRDDKLPRLTLGDRRAQTEETLDSLQQLAPSLRPQIQEIKRRLNARVPRDDERMLGFVHGDLVPGNIFVGKTSIGLIDLDKASIGCVAADIGKFLAFLKSQRLRGRHGDIAPLRDAFLDSYAKASGRPLDPEVLRWWTAAGIVHRVRKLFRQLDPERQETVERLLRDTAELLD